MKKIINFIEYNNYLARMNYLSDQNEIRELSSKEAVELDDLTEEIIIFEIQLNSFK